MNEDSSSLFRNLAGLVDFSAFSGFDFSEVKDASYMFEGAEKADLGYTNSWDSASLEKAENIFGEEMVKESESDIFAVDEIFGTEPEKPVWYTDWCDRMEKEKEASKSNEIGSDAVETEAADDSEEKQENSDTHIDGTNDTIQDDAADEAEKN
jgi:hypothetical protein